MQATPQDSYPSDHTLSIRNKVSQAEAKTLYTESLSVDGVADLGACAFLWLRRMSLWGFGSGMLGSKRTCFSGAGVPGEPGRLRILRGLVLGGLPCTELAAICWAATGLGPTWGPTIGWLVLVGLHGAWPAAICWAGTGLGTWPAASCWGVAGLGIGSTAAVRLPSVGAGSVLLDAGPTGVGEGKTCMTTEVRGAPVEDGTLSYAEGGKARKCPSIVGVAEGAGWLYGTRLAAAQLHNAQSKLGWGAMAAAKGGIGVEHMHRNMP